jgi:hypothetical protein
MMTTTVKEALALLGSESREKIQRGMGILRHCLTDLEEDDFRMAAEALCTLFYIDHFDVPDLVATVDDAVELLASQGGRVVPLILEFMRGSDLKSHFHLAQTLGKIGEASIPRLRRFLAAESDPYSRVFAQYALGKIRHAAVDAALPEVVGALTDPDKEVRDSAARTLGKIAEVVPAQRLTEARRGEMYEALFHALADVYPGVRAKAIRSLGKLARFGYVAEEQRQKILAAAKVILGEGDRYEWDHAYIVRFEAQKTRKYLEETGL